MFLTCVDLPWISSLWPCSEEAPQTQLEGLGERCKLPQRSPGRGRFPGQSPYSKRILGAFRAQNRVWWQQCDMSHTGNHSLIINIHYFWWMQCIWMQSLNGWWTKLTCTVALAKVEAQFPLIWQRLCSLCFITVLQTFCEGPNNGGPSLAKFHECQDPRTLAGSTPMKCHRSVFCCRGWFFH